jgi:hypothetical protein
MVFWQIGLIILSYVLVLMVGFLMGISKGIRVEVVSKAEVEKEFGWLDRAKHAVGLQEDGEIIKVDPQIVAKQREREFEETMYGNEKML